MAKESLLAPWQRSGLKVAFATMVERFGGYDVAAMVTGKSISTLHGYGNVHVDAFAPIDTVVLMERAWVGSGGLPLVSPLLARQIGYIQVPVPEGSGEVSRAAAAVVREAAELVATHVEAVADGNLCDADRAEIAAHCDALIDRATRLRAALAGPKLTLVSKPEAA